MSRRPIQSPNGLRLPRRMLRWMFGVAIATAAPLALTAPAAAGHVVGGWGVSGYGLSDWAYQRDRLRSEIDVAEFQLRRAQSDADAARSVIDAARNDLAVAEARVAAAERSRDDLRRHLAEIDVAMARMTADRPLAAEDRAKVRQAAEPILAAHAAAVAVQRKAEADAIAAFEAGATFQQALSRSAAAERDLSLAEQTAVDRLLKTPEYQRAEFELRSADAIVAALRAERAPGDPALAGVSQQAIDARNRLEAMKRAALDGDPGVVAARGETTLARRVLEILRDEFAKSLPTNPAVAAAAAEVAKLQPDFDRASADVKTVDDQLAAIDAAINKATADRQAATNELAKIDGDVAAARDTIAAAHERIGRASADADAALAAADDIARQRDMLIHELSSLELARPRPVFVPVCPPPVVVCPPAPICPPEPIFVPPPRVYCPPSIVINIGWRDDDCEPRWSRWGHHRREHWVRLDDDWNRNRHGDRHDDRQHHRTPENARPRVTPAVPNLPPPVVPPRQRTVVVKATNEKPFVGPTTVAQNDRTATQGPPIVPPGNRSQNSKQPPTAQRPTAPSMLAPANEPRRQSLTEIAQGKVADISSARPSTPKETKEPSATRTAPKPPFVGPTTLNSDPARFAPPEGLRPIAPNRQDDGQARLASARLAAQQKEQDRITEAMRQTQAAQAKALKEAQELAAKQREAADKLDRDRTAIARQQDDAIKQQKQRNDLAARTAKALADKEKAFREESARAAADQAKRDADLKKLRDAEQARIRADDAERARQAYEAKKLADAAAKREAERMKEIAAQRAKEGQLMDLQKKAAEDAKKHAADLARRNAERDQEIKRQQDRDREASAALRRAQEEASKVAADQARREAARMKELDLQRKAADDARRHAAEANAKRLEADRERQDAMKRQMADDARRQESARRAADSNRAEMQKQQNALRKQQEELDKKSRSGRR